MKQLSLLGLLLSTCTFIAAQTISVGPTAGFGHSWISNLTSSPDLFYTTKFNPSWGAGMSFRYISKKHFGLNAGIKYSAEGNKTMVSGFAGEFKSTINANYIRVPVQLIYCFGHVENAVRPAIYLGPSFGFLAGGKTVIDFNGSKTEANTREYIKKFDFGATAAAGLNIRLSPGTILHTDLVYYYGLSDVSEGSSGHNRSIGLNAGISIDLRK